MDPKQPGIHIAIDASPWDNERGFGRFTRSLVAALAARDTGFRYSLLFGQPPTLPVPENVDVVVAGARQSMSQASSDKGVRKGGDMLSMAMAARRLDFDLLFYPAVYSFFPLLKRAPSVICYHDTIPERFPDLIFPSKLNFRLWQAKIWAAGRQATRVMTVSEASGDDLTTMLNIPKRKIDVITEAADPVFRPITDRKILDAARVRHAIPKGAPVMIYVGGFNRHKNVIRLIEAMPEIVARVPEVRLVIVGRTTGARFWDNVDELQAGASRDATVSERIIFTGEIDDADLAVMLNVADALVFPSLWEGFGLPAVEAMACGTPVLSSDRGSLPEIVGDGGLFFDPTSVKQLVESAVKMLADASLHQQLTRRAADRAAEFSWDKGAALAESSFRRALEK